jgi:hypothetical protein
VASCREFRIHQLPVDLHIEDASASFDETCFQTRKLLDFSRRPGGLRVVVSHPAVFDGNVHEQKSGNEAIGPRGFKDTLLKALHTADQSSRTGTSPDVREGGTGALDARRNPRTLPRF